MHFLCNSHSAISICHNHHQRPFKPKRYSYSELLTATNHFSQTTLLGKGSHGAVYLATFNTTTTITAAVKLSTTAVTETAENELRILSNIRTSRIVNLIGYGVNTHVSPPRLLLVVEYMPNGSLYDLLHKNPSPPGFLTRVRFLLHIAQAVRVLHGSDPPVMHRDIKSSNILIDARGNARLSDFGLAIKAHVSDARVMSTPPAGTLGYLDPGYLSPEDLSTKSDIFSFGILLFEVISGRKAIDVGFSPPNIVEWALPLIKSGGYQEVLDRRISGWEGIHRTVVRELCLLGARCVSSTAEKRPNAAEIVDCLKKVYRSLKLMRFDLCWNLRRRVRPTERFLPSDDDWEMNRRESEGDEDELTRGRNQAVRTRLRSKSIGSFRDLAKVGPDVVVDDELIKVKREVVVTVKVSGERLSKSRSMSVLYRGKNAEIGVNIVEEFPLLVNCSGSKIQKLEIEN